MAKNDKLFRINFRKCELTDECVKGLISPLVVCKNLSCAYLCILSHIQYTLVLGKNKITNQGVKTILNVLKEIPALEELILDNNLLDAGCAQDLGTYLRDAKISPLGLAFRLLHIGKNKMGDAGAAQLAPGLAASKTLTRFHMPSNGLTGAGAKTIADSLPPTLRVLNLSKNKIGKEGAEAVGAVAGKGSLMAVYLDDCGIPYESALELAGKCRDSKKIKFLYMRKHKYDEKGQAEEILKCANPGFEITL